MYEYIHTCIHTYTDMVAINTLNFNFIFAEERVLNATLWVFQSPRELNHEA